MPKTLQYKDVQQKLLVTSNPDEIPVGSIVFWHDHRIIQEADKRFKDKYLTNPELIAHVGIIIGYEGVYPKVAHAAYEKKPVDSKKDPIKAVISCRLRAFDDRKQKEGHSFIVFKPNKKNIKNIKLTNKMVEIATKITKFNTTTKESDYDIPYSVSRSTKMSHHIRSLFTKKPKKTSYEKYLSLVTNYQIKETQYAFYHPWDYKQAIPQWEISDNPINMHANALTPFKSMAQYNHPLYQSYQKNNHKNAFTKHGFMCVQFIVWLAQCAMLELKPMSNELTKNIKRSKAQKIQDIASLSRKYTKTDDPSKWHIKRLLLYGANQKQLPSEKDYKKMFSWLDHDGKMMAPGTLIKLFMNQSDFSGGDGGKPFIVDHYHASNIDNSHTKDIIGEITDLVKTIDKLNLKHNISFNMNVYLMNFYAKIVLALAENPSRLPSLLAGGNAIRPITISNNRHIRAVARQTQPVSLFTTQTREPIQSTPSHHSYTEVQYLGEATNAIMSIFLHKLNTSTESTPSSSHKRKAPPSSGFRPQKSSRAL